METILRAAAQAGLLTTVAGGQAVAQDDALIRRGAEIYEINCSSCHQSSGEGLAPSFPALAGNERLKEAELIVQRVHYGKDSMPAFPDFEAENVAAVASYIRASWNNDFGTITVETANQLLASVEPPTETAERSVRDGVYSKEQAQNARLLYLGGCAPCHGSRLNGAPDVADMSPGPPLTGPAFHRSWNGSTVGSLFEYTRSSMPISNPGQFTDQQYIDIIAYILSYGEFPAGDAPLEPNVDGLNDILIEAELEAH